MFVIFDLDGTLLNSLPDIAAAANRVLDRFGLPTHAVDDFRRFVGDGVVMLFRRSAPPDQVTDSQIAAYVDLFKEYYAEMWHQHSVPYPGIAEMLDALQAQGVECGVLSNKPQEFTTRCVTHFFGAWRFSHVLGQQTNVPRKPDPTAALQMAADLKVEAPRCYFLGDSNVDMQTAGRAGMRAIGATWGFRTADELQNAGAEMLVDSPDEFERLIVRQAGSE